MNTRFPVYWSALALLLTLPTGCTKSVEQPRGDDVEKTEGNAALNLGNGSGITYPVADPDLGEKIQPGEVDAARAIAQTIERQINAKYPTGSGQRALRDAHPKQHGCLRARFEVEPDIPAEYAQGVFKRGNAFDAVIRFSNASPVTTQSDIEKDGRGMAFKLFDVPGKKLLEVESEALSQDFIFISHPVFFMKDPVAYIDFIKNFENSGPLAFLKTVVALGPKGLMIAKAIKSKQISSPIQTEYFSNVPYQLGVGADKKAVKYTARPCAINGTDPIPSSPADANYLRTRLIEHFKAADACMDILVQSRQEGESVENPMDEWQGPFTKVATLRMKKEEQAIAPTPDLADPLNKACDALSFNPWHALAEHKPLGSMNRVRKIVYEHISRLRHQINGETREEPTGFRPQ
jgi:hypothetical protein